MTFLGRDREAPGDKRTNKEKIKRLSALSTVRTEDCREPTRLLALDGGGGISLDNSGMGFEPLPRPQNEPLKKPLRFPKLRH